MLTRLPLTLGIAVARGLYWFIKLLPTRDKVTFISRGNDFTSIDFRLLADAIVGQSPATRVVFLNHPLKSRLAYPFRMVAEMAHIATSRAVVVDTYVIPVSVLNHKPGLIVTQMWHALGAFKAFGLMAVGRAEGSSRDLARAMHMHEKYTYVSAPSNAVADIYRQCFGVDRESIIVAGSPRVDYLTDAVTQANRRFELRQKYGIREGHEVVLFAPTFRKSSGIPVDELAREFDPERYTVVLRKHPLDTTTTVTAANVVVADEREGIELLAIADHLVTDYSAIVFEATLLNIPCYFWTFDRSEYANARGFIIDFDREAPGVLCDAARDIAEAVRSGKSAERSAAFASKYIETTGFNNAERLGGYVLGRLTPTREESS